MACLYGLPAQPHTLRSMVGDLAQLCGFRLVTLGDGPERGVEVLEARTGGGLAFSVVIDRSFDLGTLELHSMPLAWQSPVGFRRPDLADPDTDGGRGFERSFGGLLVTCGLDRIRQPEGGHPLHGRVPFTPAKLLAYGIEWGAAEPFLFCEGEIIQWRLGHECFRLRRRWEASVGGTDLRLHDTVANEAAAAWPQAMLYHINFGFPAIRSGTTVSFMDEPVLGPITLPAPEPPKVSCRRASASPTARAALRTPITGARGGELRIDLSFETDALPWFQTWLDPRPGTVALGLEPCTSERLGKGTSGPERLLEPGEERHYRWSLSVKHSGT